MSGSHLQTDKTVRIDIRAEQARIICSLLQSVGAQVNLPKDYFAEATGLVINRDGDITVFTGPNSQYGDSEGELATTMETHQGYCLRVHFDEEWHFAPIERISLNCLDHTPEDCSSIHRGYREDFHSDG